MNTKTNFDIFVDCPYALAATLVATLAARFADRVLDPGQEGFGVLRGVFPLDDNGAFWIACAQALERRGLLGYSPLTRRRIVLSVNEAFVCAALAGLANRRRFVRRRAYLTCWPSRRCSGGLARVTGQNMSCGRRIHVFELRSPIIGVSHER